MSTWRRSAFTLMEIMMVVLLTALLLIPLFKALRTGMKVSLKGMLKTETTLVARRILRQVQTDLEHVCFPLDAQGATISPQTLVRFAGAPPTTSSSFFSFPVHGAVDSIISEDPNGLVVRNACEITYTLLPGKNSMYALVRSERFHPSHPLAANFPGQTRVQTLSDQVNFFSIVPASLNTPDRSSLTFRVHLQLVDTLNRSDLVEVIPGNPVAKTLRDAAIADFFIVVNPHFFNRILNRNWFNPNWQTAISAP